MTRASFLIPMLLCLSTLPVAAQEELPPPPVPGKPQVVVAAPSLKDGLMLLDWDPARRGPLLLIGAEKAVLKAKTLPPPRNGYGLPELLGYFELQSARFPTLTTAGPATMLVLSSPSVTSFGGMQEYFRQANPLPLLESLEPNQLQQALSPAGLGYGALASERQRSLWAKMLPMTLVFQDSPLVGGVPSPLFAGQSPWWGEQQLPLLSPAARGALRLRLSLDLTLTAQPGGYSVPLRDRTGGTQQVALQALPLSPSKLSEQRREQEKLSSTQKLPYRRKPSDLDPSEERYALPLSLEGITTVGELTQRIAQTLNLELYADKRIASLSVFTKTLPEQRVSAGDALSAILRATCFTVRRLVAGRESAYVITFDRVPLGNQSVALFDSILPQLMREMESQLSLAQESTEASRKLRQKELLKLLTRGEGAQAPEELWTAAMSGQPPSPFPLSRLPSTLNERAQAIWTRVQARKSPDGTPPPQRPQALLPSANLRVLLVGEGLGTSELTTLALKDLTPPTAPPLVTLPPTLKARTLLIPPPPDAASAKRLVATARERGFTQLAVSLSGDASEDAKLAWLLAGKDALPVMPVLSPLMPAPTDTQRERDISVTGRTAAELGQGRAALGEITKLVPYITPVFRQITRLDALTPEAVPIERFATRVAKLAALPGVSSVGITALLVPGYDFSSGSNLETLWAGGYSATERLAFLRAKGSDPSDFLELEGIGSIELPYFGSGRDEQQRLWNERRKERGVQLRKRLDTAFQSLKLTKPLWQITDNGFFSEAMSWKPWKGSGAGPTHLPYWQALARRMPGMMGGQEGAGLLDDIGLTRVWLAERLRPTPADPEAPSGNPFTAQGVSPAGFVLDLSDLSFLESLKLVEATVAPLSAKPLAP